MKKIYWIIVIVAIGVFGALLLYFYLIRQSPTTDNLVLKNATNPVLGGNDNPASGIDFTTQASRLESYTDDGAAKSVIAELLDRPQMIWPVINSKIVGAVLSRSGDRIQYYDSLEKTLLSVDLAGSDPQLLDTQEATIKKLIWSPNAERFLYLSDTGKYIGRDISGYQENFSASNIESPIFVDDQGTIAYQYRDFSGEISNISIATLSKNLTDFRVLVPIRGDLELKLIPQKNALAYYLEPNLNRTSAVESVSLAGSPTKGLYTNQGLGTDACWSPDGKKMVFTQLDRAGNLKLYLSDSDGRNSKLLPVATFVDKITWDTTNNMLILAVPKIMPSISDYFSGQGKTLDRLVEIDLNTGEKIFTYNLSTDVEGKNLDMRNLFMAADGQLLYFNNQYDQALFTVNLKRLRAAWLAGFAGFE